MSVFSKIKSVAILKGIPMGELWKMAEYSTESRFYRRMNLPPWKLTVGEVVNLSNALSLTAEEVQSIFYAFDVSEMRQKPN